MNMRSFRTACALSLAITAGWVSLGAQAHFAGFTGTITSSDGLSIPNVEVVATNEATQVTYTAKSNDQGIYTISALPIGTYVVRAQAPQFRPFQTNPIRLESGQTARVNITLAVGASEQVEVTAFSPILQTQDAVVGEVISGTTIERMPLNGRNFSQLSLLLPGVITTEPEQLHPTEELRRGTAVRERSAGAGEQLHARRRRHERADRQPAAVSAQPRRAGGGAGRDQQLFGRVRQRGRRGDRQHHQVRARTSSTGTSSSTGATAAWRPTRGRTTAPARQEGRAVAAHLRRHDRRADHARTSCSSSATTRRSSATVPASWSGPSRRKRGGEAISRVSR